MTMSPAGGPAPASPAERAARKPLLEARNISKYFGAVVANSASLTRATGTPSLRAAVCDPPTPAIQLPNLRRPRT